MIYALLTIIGTIGGLALGWFLWFDKKSASGFQSEEAIVESDSYQKDLKGLEKELVEAGEEREFLETQFDLILSKLAPDAKTKWKESADDSLGDLSALMIEKDRLAAKIREFVGKVDPGTRRQMASLEEESLGIISPIQDQLSAEALARKDVESTFERLVSKLNPELKEEWETLNEGSIGLSSDNWKEKYELLLSKLSPELGDWEEIEASSLGGEKEETPKLIVSDPSLTALHTEDWKRPASSTEEDPKEEEPTEKTTEELEGEEPAWLVGSPDDEPDNLKKIWGIGPVLEKTLNTLGIYYFHQLVQLTEDAEINWVSAHLKTFPDRIHRDQWTKQAATLMEDPEAVMVKPY